MKSINIFSILLVLVASATAAYSATPLSDAELLEITGGGCGAEMCGTSDKCDAGESQSSGCGTGSCSCTPYYGPCPGASEVVLVGDGGREYGDSVACEPRDKITYNNFCAGTYGQCSGHCTEKESTTSSCGTYLPAQGC